MGEVPIQTMREIGLRKSVGVTEASAKVMRHTRQVQGRTCLSKDAKFGVRGARVCTEAPRLYKEAPASASGAQRRQPLLQSDARLYSPKIRTSS